MTAGREPSQDPNASSPSAGETKPDPAMIRLRLIELMRSGVDRRAPNFSAYPWGEEVERESVFGGSWDWHSCVIAHWCLLVTARTESDVELEGWLAERLLPPPECLGVSDLRRG